MEEFAAKSLLGKLGSSAIKELYLAWGLKAELASLEEKLLAINAVLMDVLRRNSLRMRRFGSGIRCSENSCMMKRTHWMDLSVKI
jgi:hypothetical protein